MMYSQPKELDLVELQDKTREWAVLGAANIQS